MDALDTQRRLLTPSRSRYHTARCKARERQHRGARVCVLSSHPSLPIHLKEFYIPCRHLLGPVRTAPSRQVLRVRHDCVQSIASVILDSSRRVQSRGNGRTRHEPRTDRAGDARAVGITAPRRPMRRALVRVIARGVSAGSIGMSHAPLGCRADGRRSSRDDLTRLEPASGWRSARRRWISRNEGR